MPARRTIGMFFVAMATGCAAVTGTPPNAGGEAGPLIVDPGLFMPVVRRAVAAEAPPGEPAQPLGEPQQPVIVRGEGIRMEPAAVAPASTARSPGADRAVVPSTKATANASASPAAVVQPRRIENAATTVMTAEPPLDMAGLKARLRDTDAIGVLTKLALRNQMDDLLQKFRVHYQGGQKTSVAALRQPYDLLVRRVLSVVQSGDPSLARAISASHEAIWRLLADPVTFDSIT